MWPILSSHRSEIVSQKWEITGMKSFCSSATAPVIVITAMVVVEINTDKALTSICSKHLINVMFSWILWADLWETCYIYSYFTKEKIWDNYNKQSLGIESKGTVSNHLAHPHQAVISLPKMSCKVSSKSGSLSIQRVTFTGNGLFIQSLSRKWSSRP